jgi:hypothetical protein
LFANRTVRTDLRGNFGYTSAIGECGAIGHPCLLPREEPASKGLFGFLAPSFEQHAQRSPHVIFRQLDQPRIEPNP